MNWKENRVLNSVALWEHGSSISISPEFSGKPQNLYFHTKFSNFYILTTIMLLLPMLWVPNEIKSRLLASKLNSSIHSCKKYLLSYYCYIPDHILITKEKNSEQNRQHICPHGAYCLRSTQRATQFMVVLLMYLFIKVDKNREFQRDTYRSVHISTYAIFLSFLQ